MKSYTHAQYPGGPELPDRALALKLFAGKHHTKAYPTHQELIDFGRRVCGVHQPALILQRITEAMRATLHEAQSDDRVRPVLLAQLCAVWEESSG